MPDMMNPTDQGRAIETNDEWDMEARNEIVAETAI